MVKHRVRGKHKSILEFLSGYNSVKEESSKDASSMPGLPTQESTSMDSGKTIDDLLKSIVEKKKEINKAGVGEGKKTVKIDIEKDLSIIPTGKVLEEILYKGLSNEDITCYSNGKCSDGKSIGEIFVDKYGFRRQRGFVNTTRLPVFLDWIVEEAVIEEILPKTYVVKTNRGSLAIIPEDYLCELHTRYGVIIKNYDKCKNYKPSIGGETIRSRRKR